jgi:formate dehydrogenase
MEKELENMTGKKFEEDLDLMLSKCDIVVINMPLIKKKGVIFN